MPGFVPTEHELSSRYWSRRHRAAAAHRDPCSPLKWLTCPSSSPLHKPAQPQELQTPPQWMQAQKLSSYLNISCSWDILSWASYLWPLGRKDTFKTSVTVCLQRWYHPCNKHSAHIWLFAFTKCTREHNLFVFNSSKMEVSFTGRSVFHRNRVCTLWRFQKNLRNNKK